jgi:hypothetical protein
MCRDQERRLQLGLGEKLFAGTTTSVSLEPPVTYAPYSSPWLIAFTAADWLG